MHTTEKMEGTIVLDGLIEGRLPDDAEVEEKLNKWIEFVASLGLRFNLDAGGSAFSILPDNHPMSCARLMPSPDDAIRQAVEQLVKVLPAAERSSVFSTLRSSEFRKNEEVQSLYVVAVNPAGNVEVQVQSRSVDAKTVAPPQPISVREKVKLAVLGLVFAAIFFGVAMLFPPVREKFAEFIGAIKPVQVETVTVHSPAFGDYFTAKPKEFERGARVLVVELKRTPAFPKSEDAVNEAYKSADTLSKKLALEAIARGYVRIEMVDTDGVVFATGEFRIRDLAKEDSIELTLPVTAGEKRRKLERVEIRY
jgi:hypothetical protein